jgi:hypothetical protein
MKIIYHAIGIIAVLLVIINFGCNTRPKNMNAYVKSSNKDSLALGLSEIKRVKDSIYVGTILDDPYDSRISQIRVAYGKSIYQLKMEALQRISGLRPPQEITYQPDSTIVQFYTKWADALK